MIGRIYGEDAREEAAWAIEYDRAWTANQASPWCHVRIDTSVDELASPPPDRAILTACRTVRFQPSRPWSAELSVSLLTDPTRRNRHERT